MLLKSLKISEKQKKLNREHNRLNLGLVAAVVLIVLGIIIAAVSGQAQMLLFLY